MKIILVNKFYYPKDGVSNYLLELAAQLRASGHKTRIFAMDNPKNLPCPEQKYFVSYLSFDQGGLKNTWRAAARIFYSQEAKRKFQALIQDFQPDIVHVHNLYHQISPSILSVTKKAKIPVVMHLHDYKLICPNYKLFTKNQICKRCHGGAYYQCLLNKCLKDSWLKSLAGSLEMYLHHQLWPIYKNGVDLFIAPSKFMEKTCQNFGWPAKKIRFLNNFYTAGKSGGGSNGSKGGLGKSQDYLLYFGRLAPEKGVDLIISALSGTKQHLKIAGEGPAEKTLKEQSRKLGLSKQIEFLGFQTGATLKQLIKGARAVIIPSRWLENMPLNLLESLSHGKTVIAAAIGGIPEIIQDKKNGFLFPPEDVAALRKIIGHAQGGEFVSAAKSSVEDLDPKKHCQKIIAIYKEAIRNKQPKKNKPKNAR